VDLIWVNNEGLIAMKLYALKDEKLRKGKDLRNLQ
jgi:hypothetical protein